MQNKKIIESPGLLVAGTVWCALCIVICGLCTWVIHNGFVITTTYRDWIGCQIIFVFMALYIIGCFIMALPRWLRLILFDEKMIVIKSVYGAKVAMHYADINDILLYREQRGVRLISFIVISKDKLYIKSSLQKKQSRETIVLS